MARLNATIELLQLTGSRSFATFRLGDASALAELQAHDVSNPGETIALDVNLNRARYSMRRRIGHYKNTAAPTIDLWQIGLTDCFRCGLDRQKRQTSHGVVRDLSIGP